MTEIIILPNVLKELEQTQALITVQGSEVLKSVIERYDHLRNQYQTKTGTPYVAKDLTFEEAERVILKSIPGRRRILQILVA